MGEDMRKQADAAFSNKVNLLLMIKREKFI
jgi:hypothetical protein